LPDAERRCVPARPALAECRAALRLATGPAGDPLEEQERVAGRSVCARADDRVDRPAVELAQEVALPVVAQAERQDAGPGLHLGIGGRRESARDAGASPDLAL